MGSVHSGKRLRSRRYDFSKLSGILFDGRWRAVHILLRSRQPSTHGKMNFDFTARAVSEANFFSCMLENFSSVLQLILNSSEHYNSGRYL